MSAGISSGRRLGCLGGRFLSVLAVAIMAVTAMAQPGLSETPEAQAARRARILVLMAQEGLSPENCRLKGVNIEGKGARILPEPFSRERFPYKWDFDDGTLCGINEVGSGIKNIRVEEGKLKFGTERENAQFSWGSFDRDKPGLRFGYDAISVRAGGFAYLQVRMRQSLPESNWQAIVKDSRRKRFSAPVAVKGTDWQTVTIPLKIGYGPYPGVGLLSDTRDNTVEIDWVQPCIYGGRPCFRKTIETPSPVRWAKCSISTGPRFALYVNGKPASKSPLITGYKHMWNYDLDPTLFRKGRNVIAIETAMVSDIGHSRGAFTLDGALLCEDGTTLRFDSDTSWRFRQGLEDIEWTRPDYDATDWGDTEKCWQPTDYPPRGGKCWFNPSYKGRIMVSPADGRPQPVYGHSEDIALRVAVPKRAGETHELSYQVFDEMGDGFRARDVLVAEGELGFRVQGSGVEGLESAASAEPLDEVGLLTFGTDELKPNIAYAVVFHLKVNGEELEKRRYEIAVCGPVNQPVVENPKDYTDGMDLKLVWEVDAAAEQDKASFLSCDGNGTVRESDVVDTPLGRFRRPWPEKNVGTPSPCNYISFKYRIDNPGRPHVAIAEYPDDTERIQEMRVVDQSPLDELHDKKANMLGNHTAILGIEHPLTHAIRRHHVVFFPNENVGTVTIFSVGQRKGWQPSMAARVGKIRIHEIMNDIPVRKIVDAPGPKKWLGQQPERGPIEVMTSCFASPISGLIRKNLICSDTPNFYRNWMLTSINMVKRLRFAGENTIHFGQYMYNGVLYPSVYADATTQFHMGYSGDLRDYGVLMAKMFEENDMGWFSSLEFWGMDTLLIKGSDRDVAEGMDTLAQVGKDGRQQTTFRNRVLPNYLHPEVRKHFDTVINELIALYGREPGWNGITLQLNEVLGPCWTYSSPDPYFASYDDTTIALFEKETGVKIPVGEKDLKRFNKRYTWLMANAKKEWTDWRCKKLAEVYAWVKTRLKETRSDLRLVIYISVSNYMRPPLDEPWEMPVYEYARQGGIDIERFRKDPDIIVFVNGCSGNLTEVGQTVNPRRHRSRDGKYFAAMGNDGQNGITVRYGWEEPDAKAPPGWVWQLSDAESWPYPSGEYFADNWVNAFIRNNPAHMMHALQDISMWTGRETDMSRFAQAFRSIPAGTYTRLTGNGRDRNVWIATCSWPPAAPPASADLTAEREAVPLQGVPGGAAPLHAPSVYGYIANPMWWEVDAKVTLAKGARAFDLIEDRPIRGRSWKLHMAPYSIHTFRLTGAGGSDVLPVSCDASVSKKGQKATRALVQEAEKRLEENRDVLKRSGLHEIVEKNVALAQQSLEAGDFSRPYEQLTAYPYTKLWITGGEGGGAQVKSTHLAFKKAQQLYKEKNIPEALTAIRDAMLNDIWDKHDRKDLNLLRQAYQLAWNIAKAADDMKAYIAMTDPTLHDKDLPIDMKAWVIGGFRSNLLISEDPEKARNEADWLIKTPEAGSSRWYGYSVYFYLDRDADLEKKFWYQATIQTLRGGTVNYVYEGMGNNRLKAKQYLDALGLYLRAWSGSEGKTAETIQTKLETCLTELGRTDELTAWKPWLKLHPERRGPCPILDIGTIPKEWEEKWQKLPEEIEVTTGKDLISKSQSLHGLGRIREAKSVLEQGITQARNEGHKDWGRSLRKNYEKWGTELPEKVP